MVAFLPNNLPLLVVGIVAALPLPWTATAAPVTDKRAPQVIPGKYIVTLKPGVPLSTVDAHLSWVRRRSVNLSRRESSGVEKVYSIENFNAYAGSFDAATIEEIRNSEDVSFFFDFLSPFLLCF